MRWTLFADQGSLIIRAAGTADGESTWPGGTRKEAEISQFLPAHTQPTLVVLWAPGKICSGWCSCSLRVVRVKCVGSKSISPRDSKAFRCAVISARNLRASARADCVSYQL